jgi:hypothetical protein
VGTHSLPTKGRKITKLAKRVQLSHQPSELKGSRDKNKWDFEIPHLEQEVEQVSQQCRNKFEKHWTLRAA